MTKTSVIRYHDLPKPCFCDTWDALVKRDTAGPARDTVLLIRIHDIEAGRNHKRWRLQMVRCRLEVGLLCKFSMSIFMPNRNHPCATRDLLGLDRLNITDEGRIVLVIP